MIELKYSEIGRVKSVRGCIVVVEGLNACINGQLVDFGFGTKGLILGFNEKEAQILIIKEAKRITTGDEVRASLEPFDIPVGENFIGRVVNSLCEPFDGQKPVKQDAFASIFPAAPGILDRQELKNPLETGLKVLDTMTPVGHGQRQLILGNKMTGKTSIITDTILNQKNTGVICIYCAIGKARAQLDRVVELLKVTGALDYTIVVAAPSSSPPGQQYLAPYVACSLGEYFMNKGQNVFVGFDDFTKHAWCYREISLLLGRAPGRDSYPGDIFYLHSKMIERACHLSEENGGGSMTFLPIVEILEGDLTAFVPSNLISMTDGQIMLDAAMFGEGQRPAIDLGLSVSRTGSKVQWPIVKDLGAPLRLEFLQYKEVQRISKLRSGSMSDEMVEKLANGAILSKILIQEDTAPVLMEKLVLILFAYRKGKLREISLEELDVFQGEIYPFALKENEGLMKKIRENKKMDDEIEQGLTQIVDKYIAQVVANKGEEDVEDDLGEDIVSNIGRDVLDEASSQN